jgi:hypothetical protein
MKTIALFIALATVILTTGKLRAAALENDFVRKAGQYSLDATGSTLTILKQPSGAWSLKVAWRSGDAVSSAAPDNCLRAEGWFVFVERSGRIWVFDGRDSGVVLTHSDKDLRVSTFSREAMRPCPQKVWEALPQSVREKYPGTEPGGAANRSQPVRSGTNPTSSAAGSAR